MNADETQWETWYAPKAKVEVAVLEDAPPSPPPFKEVPLLQTR